MLKRQQYFNIYEPDKFLEHEKSFITWGPGVIITYALTFIKPKINSLVIIGCMKTQSLLTSGDISFNLQRGDIGQLPG